MATETTVNRIDDPSTGQDFATYDKASGAKTQAMNLDPEVGGSQLKWATTPGAAAVEQAVISTSAGSVFKVDVVLNSGVTADRWLMVFDKATAPIGGDDPILRARISGGFASIDLGVYGRSVSAGVAVAISTSIGTLSLPGSGEGFFQVGYF